MDISLFKESAELVKKDYPNIDEVRWLHETIRRIMYNLICDICEASAINLAKFRPKTIDEVRTLPSIINLSKEMTQKQLELKKYLRHFLYQHERVVEMTNNAKKIIKDLFLYFSNEPTLMPEAYQMKSTQNVARAVADYLAGMTDRYAIKTHTDIKLR